MSVLVITRRPEFERDLKRLRKRYLTLDDDLRVLLETQLPLLHLLELDNGGIVRIDGLGLRALPLIKVRRFACRSLPGKGSRTGLRLIYAFDKATRTADLIELYMKAEQSIEDRDRIARYYPPL